MRLIKLKIRNIASLKGEHLIEFDTITNTSALFAITGETGSGKSSILNAIAMALYGRVYKSTLNQADIVTLGERDAHIQLIFSIKGEYYLADWIGKIRKQNGELLKTPNTNRVIHKLDSPSFEATRSQEVYQSEDLLNLNFDQFCKCIILNQGEFAKFLSSSFTDRKAILEKLYPGSEIENVSRYLKVELDNANNKMSVITTQLDTLSIAPNQGDILGQQLNELTRNIKEKSTYQKRYSKYKRAFESLESYFQYFQDNTQRRSKLQIEINEITGQFNTALALNELRQKEWDSLTTEIEQRTPVLQDLIKKEEQLKHLKLQIKDLENKITSSQSLREQNLVQIEEDSSKKKEWQKVHQKTLESFHFNSDSLFSLRIELENFVDNFSKIEKLEIEHKNLKNKLSEVETRGKELKLEITNLEQGMPESPDKLKIDLSQFKEKKIQAQQLINNREVKLKTQELSLLKINSLTKDLTKLKAQREELQSNLSKQNAHLKSLELSLNVFEYKLGIKKCITHAKELKPSHCPICESSTDEAFWNKLTLDFSDSDIEGIQNAHEELTKTINDLKNHEQLLLSQSKQTETNISELQLELSKLEIDLGQPLPEIKLIETQIEEIEKKLIHFEHQEKELKRLNSEINQVRTLFLQSKEALSSIEEKLLPITVENEQLYAKVHTIDPMLATKLSELKADLRLLIGLTQERKQGEALEQNLVYLREKLGALEENLRDLRLELKNHQTLQQQLTLELSEKLKIGSAQAELSTLQTRYKEASALVQNAQAQQKTIDQSLSLKRGTLATIEQLLSDYELKFIEARSEIQTIAQEALLPLNDELAHFEEKLKVISLTLNDSIDLISSAKNRVNLTLTECEASLMELNNQLGGVKEKLSHWDKTQDKIKLLQLEFSEAKAKLERFKRLSTILGTDELRTFALSLVEENLIIQTNEELSRLCQSRYQITHRSRRGITPEFYILDKFREGEERKVSTLSGGETFMVSLAMALALAEMTRGQAEIDTLFIDEGFGTLDQESLEDVLDMLNQIQNRGLMIGIISHIKTLTNAMGVNLTLNKASDGTSKISLQFN